MIEDLFINVLEISITSAAAIAVIFLISNLAESRFRRKWRYWVWVFLAIYLINPFKVDFPNAPIKMEIPPHEMIITQREEVVPGESALQNASGAAGSFDFAETENAEDENAGISGTEGETLGTEPDTAPKRYIFPVVFVGAVLWIAGAVIVCGWNVAMYLRFVTRARPWNRKIENEEVLELFEAVKQDMGISRNIKLFENRLIKSPMMVGFFSPRVLLPAEELLPEEYEFVLRHELTHYKRGDIWYKFILMMAASIHWFNPLVGTMCRHADNDIEITCDEAVVKAMEGDRRQEYCATILNIMRRGQNSPLLLSTSFYGGAKVLKKRFSAVLEPKAHRGIVLFVIAVLVIVISGTMVACGTAQPPVVEEPEVLPEQQEQEEPVIKEENEIIAEATEIAEKVYRQMTLGGKADFEERISADAENYIRKITDGKQEYYQKNDIGIRALNYEIGFEVFNVVENEGKTEIILTASERYGWWYNSDPDLETKDDRSGFDRNHIRLCYDAENDIFESITVYNVTWMDGEFYENIPEEYDLRPAVKEPDSDGYYGAVTEEDWEKWVTYYGPADKEKPEESIPSLLEIERTQKYLKDNYPEIDDWEIVYEYRDYYLENTYDPYTYSYREYYIPKWLLVLKTEQGEDFDRLFLSGDEDIAVWSYYEDGKNYLQAQKNISYFEGKAFEKDINAGDFAEAMIVENGNSINTIADAKIWFSSENRMLFTDMGSMRVYEIKGIKEPLDIYSGEPVFNGYDINGQKLEATDGRENDLFIFIGTREDMRVAYYDAETKTVDTYENCVPDESQIFPQIHFLDSDVLVIEAGGNLSFYRTASHNLMTEAFAEIGGNGKGLCEGKATNISFLGIDKTKGGRYMFIYNDEDKKEYAICTFDKKGNILSNFGLGLSSEGTIGSANYKSGIVYFSYYKNYSESLEGTNFAVDARTESKHKLQANAW